MAIFNVGESYRRDHIASQAGASVQDFLIRGGGQVVGCCYRPELNIEALATLLVGQGRKKFRAAEIFATQNNFIPFFVRRATHDYEYIGDYRAVRSSKNPQVLAIEKEKGKDPNVEIALYLEGFNSTS